MFRNAMIFSASALVLAACSNSEDGVDAPVDDTADTALVSDQADETAMAEVEAGPETGSLEWVLAGDWRGENANRDVFRNPAETLTFMEVDPSATIIEIWPGGGWYAEVLAPWIEANGGTYIAAHFPLEGSSETRVNMRNAFASRFVGNEPFGDVQIVDFGAEGFDGVEVGSVDTILTFRNVHNWMAGGYASMAFDSFFEALRPGGTLGVVEHRLPDTREQDPRAGTGYVQEAYVIALAQEAGFELVGSSEINANPADTADHPNGVWTLPPVRAGWQAEGIDGDVFEAIGESDRMTLLFRKPEDVPVIETEETQSGEDG